MPQISCPTLLSTVQSKVATASIPLVRTLQMQEQGRTELGWQARGGLGGEGGNAQELEPACRSGETMDVSETWGDMVEEVSGDSERVPGKTESKQE